MSFVTYLRRYSSVNQDIQTASMRASLGLSMRLPSESLCCIAGIVFRVIPDADKFGILCELGFSRNLPTVETTTKAMEMQDMTCNCGIVKKIFITFKTLK